MQEGILKKIDDLVDMAESTANIDILQAELEEIEKESSKLKNELSSLTSQVPENKYFKASDKQVDESIKVSLESKIKKQEKSIQKLQKEIDGVSKEEMALHKSIVSKKNELESCNEYMETIYERLDSIKDKDSKDNYESLLQESQQQITELNSLLNEQESSYQTVLEHLNYLTLAKEEMIAKLTSDKEQLADIKASLINPSSYVDEDLKELDEKRIEEIKKQLAILDKRRIEIITDPGMIAKEAKELIVEDDRTSALSKVKELVTLVKAKPFMDIPNNSDLNAILQEELNTASNNRDEFAALIDAKDYTGVNLQVISTRIEFLTLQISKNEAKIKQLQEEIGALDTHDFKEIRTRLLDAIAFSNELEQNIATYEEVMASDEEKTPKRRAILSAAFEKKKRDLAAVNKVISSYKNDQKELIHRAYEIENLEITRCEKNIQVFQEEMDILNKLLLGGSKTKDVLAIESDKSKLKELDETVKAIKHRQKYAHTANEIFDEIEMYLGTIEDEEPSSEENSYEPYDFSALLDKEEEQENTENTKPLEVEDVMRELPEIDTEEIVFDTEEQRLKVISVEPIDTEAENQEQENPYIIADYKDDDYIEVSSLFDGDGVI